jgi:hypothetical protein
MGLAEQALRVALIDHDRASQSRESAQPSDECGILAAI